MVRLTMFHNTLICRTGLARGVLYNGVGENLTDTPGAGNGNVGTYTLDFSGIQVVNLANTGNSALIDNEYTFVLADGRGLEDDNLDDDNDLDVDEINPETEDGTFIDESVRFARVDNIDIDFAFVHPQHRHAATAGIGDNGEVDTVENSLDGYLDLLRQPASEATTEVDVWSELRSMLRWTLHWALLLVDCASTADEGQNDYNQENNADLNLANNPVPVRGPGGFMTALGGPAVNTPEGTRTHIRLWMPMESGEGMRVIRRGQRILTFNLRADTSDNSTPDDVHDLDVLDADPDIEHHGWAMPAVDSVRGKSTHLRFNMKRAGIRINDNQMLIFVLQSGRARLEQGEVGDGVGRDLLMTGPSAVQGRNGPLFFPYYWYARISGQVR